MRADKNWAMALYDRVIAEAGEAGLGLGDARKRYAQLYQKAIDNGEIDLQKDPFSEGLMVFDSLVTKGRDSRRNSFKTHMEEVLSALREETLLGHDDPVFRQAMMLGNGWDKILGMWSADDWRDSVIPRYRNAAAVAVAAEQFDLLATDIADMMAIRGLRLVWDGFPEGERVPLAGHGELTGWAHKL